MRAKQVGRFWSCQTGPSKRHGVRAGSALDGKTPTNLPLQPGSGLESGAQRREVCCTQSAMKSEAPVVHRDPEIMGGTPVFVGTRVPFQTLLDYLEAGDPLGDFLEDFPTVTREQAVAALEQAKQALLARENPA